MHYLQHFSIAVLVLGLFLLVENVFSSETNNELMSYTRLSVDQSGDTFFKEESINGNIWPSGQAMVSLEESSETVRFFRAKPGWKMLDLHYAPRKQYLIVLKGSIEIHTSKNQVRQFNQGSVLLVEDTYGKGHRTRNAGEQDLILAWVSIDK